MTRPITEAGTAGSGPESVAHAHDTTPDTLAGQQQQQHMLLLLCLATFHLCHLRYSYHSLSTFLQPVATPSRNTRLCPGRYPRRWATSSDVEVSFICHSVNNPAAFFKEIKR